MEAVGASDLVRAVELNRLFHRELVAGSGNRVLMELFDSLHSRLIRVALSALRVDTSRIDVICREHRELVEALDDGDEAKALAMLDRHLRPLSQIIAQLPQ